MGWNVEQPDGRKSRRSNVSFNLLIANISMFPFYSQHLVTTIFSCSILKWLPIYTIYCWAWTTNASICSDHSLRCLGSFIRYSIGTGEDSNRRKWVLFLLANHHPNNLSFLVVHWISTVKRDGYDTHILFVVMDEPNTTELISVDVDKTICLNSCSHCIPVNVK